VSQPAANGGPTPRDVRWSRHPVAPSSEPYSVWPATPEAIGDARRTVAGLARDAGASEDTQAEIMLAVSEACTNAVMHAYAAPGVRGGRFVVSTRSRGAHFSVWVADDGRGAPPDGASPGMGAGLQVMAALCERLDLGVLADGRTQVEMRFALR
jgi:anti-sigma regulatory factor (Ser/Thr protein kinase)